MKLDLRQIASAKAAGHKGAGLDYLLSPVRRELEARWATATDGGAGGSQARVLLLDFDHSDLHLGAAVAVRRVSALESARAPGALSDHADGGFDGVVMCLQPAWLDWAALLDDARRALRPGGRLLFATFGPDTLEQLRWAWQQADPLPHVHAFTDMHLLGDQLLTAGFTRPVVDADWVTVEYDDDALLYADLRAAGFTNILHDRRKTLTGKHRFARFRAALEELRQPGKPLAITFELIYGVASAPPPPGASVSVAVAPPR